MKKILFLAVLPLLALMALTAQAVPLAASGQAEFTLTAYAQSYSGVVASIHTNHTATVTNVTTVTKWKATNAPIDSADILRLLENSFKTNFPSGAKLIMSGAGDYNFFVVDNSGSNILLNVSGVLAISSSLSVNSGLETFTQTTRGTGTSVSGNNTQRFIEYATLTYNDTALTTEDGTQTDFQLSGVLVEMLSTNFKTHNTTESVTLRAAGTGTIRGKTNVILKGTVTGTLAGALVG